MGFSPPVCFSFMRCKLYIQIEEKKYELYVTDIDKWFKYFFFEAVSISSAEQRNAYYDLFDVLQTLTKKKKWQWQWQKNCWAVFQT